MKGELRILAGNVAHLRPDGVVLNNPIEIPVRVRRVDAEEVMVLRQAVHHAVIDGASFWMHQGAVLGLKILQAGRVVGSDVLEER